MTWQEINCSGPEEELHDRIADETRRVIHASKERFIILYTAYDLAEPQRAGLSLEAS